MSRLLVGHSASLDVPAALGLLPKPTDLNALVSMLDSTPNVAELPSFVPLLERSDVPYTVVGTDVAVAVEDLIRLQQEHQIFTGFDEVWLFTSRPSEPKPADIQLTSDLTLKEAPVGLEGWMRECDCLAGLGDGDGLNFVTFDPELAALWQDK